MKNRLALALSFSILSSFALEACDEAGAPDSSGDSSADAGLDGSMRDTSVGDATIAEDAASDSSLESGLDASPDSGFVDAGFTDGATDAQLDSQLDSQVPSGLTLLERPSGATSFGYRLALSSDGNTLAVGAPGAAGGAAYVYTRTNNLWSAGTALNRPASADEFGEAIDISADGNVIVVGDHDAGDGANGGAYVYIRSGSTWSTGTSLQRPNDAASFGWSVSVSGDGSTVVVGDPGGRNTGYGLVSVYERSASVWNLAANLDTPAESGDLGITVSISADGNTIAAGDDISSSGKVHVYAKTNNAWGSPTSLSAPEGSYRFGRRLDLSANGNRLIVGAQGGALDTGVASIYTRNSGWTLTATRLPSANGRSFASSVALSADGNLAVIGDEGSSNLGESVGIFSIGASSVDLVEYIAPPINISSLGSAAAASSDMSIVAIGSPDEQASAGIVAVYSR